MKTIKTELDEDLLRRAVETYGVASQVSMLVEECSELMNALMKYGRNRVGVNEVLTEIADVQIMCAQMEIIFAGGTRLVEMERAKKMDRLRQRLGE